METLVLKREIAKTIIQYMQESDLDLVLRSMRVDPDKIQLLLPDMTLLEELGA